MLIQEETFQVEKKVRQIQFVWIPIWVYSGNEIVDQKSHNAITSLSSSSINTITFSDAKNQINFLVNNKWHSHW